jgi:hypothetical protein
MGKGNSTTDTRSLTCDMPPNAPGVGPWIEPVTQGRENVLEVLWTKEDATLGLHLPATDVRIGVGGEWVILCGKQTLSA